MLAIFAIVCANAQVYVYQEDFENGLPATWQNIDNDGDSFSWIIVDTANDKMAPHTGLYSVSSASFDNPSTTVLHPDNWLITDSILIPQVIVNGQVAPVTLSWWDAAQDPNYPSDHYEIYISTTGNTVAHFTTPAVFTKTLSTSSWTNETVDLTAYAGQKIYIAFVHNKCSDEFMMKIDDIEIYYIDDPTILVNPASIDFGTHFSNSHSNPYTVNLKTLFINSTVTAQTHAPFEISTDSVNWSTSLSLSPATTQIVARYSPLYAVTDNDTIMFTCDTVSAFVALTGTAIDSCSIDPIGFEVVSVSNTEVDFTWNAVNNAEYVLEMITVDDTAYTVVANNITVSNPVLYTLPVEESTLYGFRLKQHCVDDTIYSDYVYTIALTAPFTGAYAHSTYPESYLYSIDVNDPSNGIAIYVNDDDDGAFAGDYYNGKYYYVNSEMEFFSVEMGTFKTTTIGTIDAVIIDMAYDYANNIMYAIDTNSLLTLDLGTGAELSRVLITGIPNGALVLAIDEKGTIFAIEYSSGDLYTIDAVTGVATLIGATGVGNEYVQSMSYDWNEGVLYWAQYNDGTEGNLRVVDPVTAKTFNNGALCSPSAHEVGALFFPYTYNPTAPEKPSMTVTPDTNFGTFAIISVTNISNDIEGNPFTGTVDSIVITRNGSVIYVETVNTALGSTITFTDNDPSLKNCVNYIYQAYAMTSEGKTLVATSIVSLGDCCDLVFNMYDSYGDGWDNGGHSINVIVNNDLYASLTCPAYSLTENLSIENGSSVTLTWYESTTGYPSEISFTVTDAFGQTVYAQCNKGQASTYTNGYVLASFTHTCSTPTCIKPIDVTVDNFDNESISISWNDTTSNSLWVVEYGVAGFELGTGTTVTATAKTYTITGLTPNTTYDIYVYADCGADDGFSAEVTTSGTTKVCADENRCTLTINMHDEYGDGWLESAYYGLITYYGYLLVKEDGQTVGYAILEDGEEGTETLEICNGANIEITWEVYGELEYAYEISFDILVNDNPLVSVADASTLTSGQVVKSFVNTCGVGIEENTSAEQSVVVYPNPTKDILNVRAEGFNQVEVVNFLGQVVYSAQVEGSDFQISTSKLTSGVYFLRLSGDNVVTKKFVKE